MHRSLERLEALQKPLAELASFSEKVSKADSLGAFASPLTVLLAALALFVFFLVAGAVRVGVRSGLGSRRP
jgi:hypothetical protein